MKTWNISKNFLNTVVKNLSSMLPSWTTSEFEVKDKNDKVYLYTLPINYIDLPVPFANQFDREVIIKPSKVYYLRDVYANWQGMIFKNLKIFAPSLINPEDISYFQEALLLKQWIGKVIDFKTPDGLAIVHNQHAPHNYYHWMIDALQRLLVLKDFHPNIPLLLPKNSPSYITQTAIIFGFNKFIEINTREVIKSKIIVLPDEHAAPLGHNDPELIRKVRTLLLDNLGNPKAKVNKRLYLSREHQKLRKVENQIELDVLLDKYNFEKVYFEGFSLKEQIHLMQEANVVLGVHGANLVNCLFVPENTSIIELQSLSLSNPEYWRLCSALSMPYYCLPCSPVVEEPVSYHSNVNIVVDVKKLESIFIAIGL